MDNCGSPETRRVVDRFSKAHIRYFRSATRRPTTDNWELGLSHATGDYITFLDDDDGPAAGRD
jgi:glycosyltransferase involved in cell wall biosynthesis